MTELAAGTLQGTEGRSGRPGFRRSVFWTCLAASIGAALGVAALTAPSFVGVAVFPLDSGQYGQLDWYRAGTTGALVANAAAMLVLVWACTLTVRSWLTSFSETLRRPAWTWTALTIAPVAMVAASTGRTTPAAGAVAGLALRVVAYRADGTPRPDPLAAILGRRVRIALVVAVPVVAIGVATAYAIYHPLTLAGLDDPAPIARATTPVLVYGPMLRNDGGRPVTILAVEPGEEHGFALHLTDVEILPDIGYLRDRKPFRPFVVGAHGDSYRAGTLMLTVSRAGCRPGTSGRIDSVRVRYDLGGTRSTLLKLERPLTLSC
jgi:hypothetical protein